MSSRAPHLISASTTDAIVHLVNAINPDVPVYDVATMEQRVQDSMARQRFAMTMLGGFAGFAMILAAIGIYGVMSFLVTQGTADIAIRMALGARRASILSLVFQQGMTLALVGIIVGLVAALGLTRMMSSLLFGVTPTDPFTFLLGKVRWLFFLLLVALFGSSVKASAGRCSHAYRPHGCACEQSSNPIYPTECRCSASNHRSR